VGIVLFASLSGMALGGWLSGLVFDWTGSYLAAFLNGVAWNAVNVVIVATLLLRGRAPGAARGRIGRAPRRRDLRVPTRRGVDAPRTRAGEGDVEEDEAVEDRRIPAIQRREQVPRRMADEIGEGHLARGHEGRPAA
jgi:hypothetical protein